MMMIIIIIIIIIIITSVSMREENKYLQERVRTLRVPCRLLVLEVIPGLGLLECFVCSGRRQLKVSIPHLRVAKRQNQVRPMPDF
jgi:hypothetical protein